MQLLTYPGNRNAFKGLIAAEYVGVKIDVPPFTMGVDNVSPDFLKKNPFGQVQGTPYHSFSDCDD